jgi:hypothetical protein
MIKRRKDENDEWCQYNPLKRWENENEEKQKEKEEEEEGEEEEGEEEEGCGFTWETIEESLNEGTLHSMLYNELLREVYFSFKLFILEEHTRYLKRSIISTINKSMTVMK